MKTYWYKALGKESGVWLRWGYPKSRQKRRNLKEKRSTQRRAQAISSCLVGPLECQFQVCLPYIKKEANWRMHKKWKAGWSENPNHIRQERSCVAGEAIEPRCSNPWRLHALEPTLYDRRGHCSEKPAHHNSSGLHSLHLGRAHKQQWRPSTAENK